MSNQEVKKDPIDINDEKAMNLDGIELRKKFCFTAACENVRAMFRWFTSIIAVGNAALDILYTYDTVYSSPSVFYATISLLLVRVLGATIIGQYFYSKMRNEKEGLSAKDEHQVKEDDDDDPDKYDDGDVPRK